ncbi:MAG TPA: sigma-70 family RNA polymerase sigma factor [Actinomycetota bacterium]|nr:sigma-70 family RNA polymerase sigma factor [Actinomycetota bacterium]
MDEGDGRRVGDPGWLAERFEENRTHLRAVAYRMLGSSTEADDAVQEAWLRLSRSDVDEVENLGGWLTTVVARVCLDMLRSRTSRREDPLHEVGPAAIADAQVGVVDPEREALVADEVGPALLAVLEALAPAERIAFVLHDLFGVPFDEIAPVVGRSPAATRQLASRARRRVRGADPVATAEDRDRQRAIVDAFLAAARGGDLDALLELLDPDVVVRADPAAAAMGAPVEVVGAPDVAATYVGRARVARPALVGGTPGLVWARGDEPMVAFAFATSGGRVVGIELIADVDRLRDLAIAFVDD